jgi:hypothetical protein
MKKTEQSPTNFEGIESVLDIGLCKYDPIIVFQDVNAKNNQTKPPISIKYGFQLQRKSATVTASNEPPVATLENNIGTHPANY